MRDCAGQGRLSHCQHQRVLGGLARPVRGPHLQPVHPDILLQRQGQNLLAAGPEPATQLSAVQIV